MEQFNYNAAIKHGETLGKVDPPVLSIEDKQRWNGFIHYLSVNKLNKNPDLDKRDVSLGMTLLNQYNKENPKSAVDPSIIPRVQNELQLYRANLVKQWKAGKIQSDVKSEAEIMPGISSVDGWPGTKTLSSAFPEAHTDAKDYGLNVDAFDKDRGLASNK